VAYDPEQRLALCVMPGARNTESVEVFVGDVTRRTKGRGLVRMTGDGYPAYETAILNAYGQEVSTTPKDRPSRRMTPEKVPPPELTYAKAEKRREKGRVVEVPTRVVFGTMAAIAGALAKSKVGRSINVMFLERQNATGRHRNSGKVRKTYTFSKEWRVHEAMTFFTMYSYNFMLGSSDVERAR
jgi:hypothetical protein